MSASLIDVAMIAFNAAFRAGDEFLSQQIKANFAQLRPQASQRFGVFDVKGLAQSERVVPAFEPRQRLDDEREGEAEIGGSSAAGSKRRPACTGKSVAFREDLEACLVEQILDQRFVGNDEPKRLRQTLTMARDQEHLCIFFVKQNRGLGLGLAEVHQGIDESLAIFGVISPN